MRDGRRESGGRVLRCELRGGSGDGPALFFARLGRQ